MWSDKIDENTSHENKEDTQLVLQVLVFCFIDLFVFAFVFTDMQLQILVFCYVDLFD